MANKVILSGPQQLLKPLITEVMALSQLLGDIENEGIGRSHLAAPKRKGKPQVHLFFREKKEDAAEGYQPLKGDITFRLMDEKSTTITSAEVIALAERIKAKFATPAFAWYRGKELVSYSDWDKGYQLQIVCKDVPSGKAVVDQVLELQGHTFDLKSFNHVTNGAPMERYPTIPEKVVILEETVQDERQRPMGTVWFQWAKLYLAGRRKPVNLVDLTGRLSNVKVTV